MEPDCDVVRVPLLLFVLLSEGDAALMDSEKVGVIVTVGDGVPREILLEPVSTLDFVGLKESLFS